MDSDTETGYQLAAVEGIDRQKITLIEVDRTDGDLPGEYTLTAKVHYRARPSVDEPEQQTVVMLTLTVEHEDSAGRPGQPLSSVSRRRFYPPSLATLMHASRATRCAVTKGLA